MNLKQILIDNAKVILARSPAADAEYRRGFVDGAAETLAAGQYHLTGEPQSVSEAADDIDSVSSNV